MMSAPSAIVDQVDEIAMFEDRADRIEALLAVAEEYRHPDPITVERTESNRVPGCESEVFFQAFTSAQGRLEFRFAVDNPQGISAMALAVVLERGSGAPVRELEEISEKIVYDLFGNELSMGKNLGLTNMVRLLKQAARIRHSN